MIPKIRFEGYTGPWDQRKVSDVAEIVAGGTPSTGIVKYWEPKEIPWLSSGEVHKKYIAFTDNMISKEGMNNSSAKIIKENSVLIALAGQGKTRGTVAINRIPLTTNQSIAAMTFDDDIIPEFIFCNLENRYGEIRKMSSGDGSRGGLNKQLVGNIEIPYTSEDEQKKIGEYFTNLDALITLHQNKLTNLQNLKTSMLEKMFPKEGEKVPEIRFEGFIEDWEHGKLEDYLEVSREKNKDEVYGKGEVLSVSGEYGIVNQIEFQGRSFAGASVANYGIVNVKDVVYTKSPLKSNPYGIIKTNKGKPGIVSTLYAIYKPKPNADSEFIQSYFELDSRINSYMHPLVNKGAKNDMKVSDENALKGPVIFPKLEEQMIISQYFNRLDNLITLHQRKLTRLQSLKKAMLEKMFV